MSIATIDPTSSGKLISWSAPWSTTETVTPLLKAPDVLAAHSKVFVVLVSKSSLFLIARVVSLLLSLLIFELRKPKSVAPEGLITAAIPPYCIIVAAANHASKLLLSGLPNVSTNSLSLARYVTTSVGPFEPL